MKRGTNGAAPRAAAEIVALPPDHASGLGLDALLTVEDVARWLKVPPSWVYERTRQRGRHRLPCVRLGKYVRFEARAVRAFLARQRDSG